MMRFHQRAGRWDAALTWRDRSRAVSASPAWLTEQRSASEQRRYHRESRSKLPRRSTAPATPSTINDGVSRDGGALLLTNSTDEIRTYTVEVEFRQDNRVIALARGTAEQVRPGERRSISLPPPPPNLETENYVAVIRSSSRITEAGQQTRAAARLRLVEPTELGDLGLDVLVANDDVRPHSLVVQAIIGQDGKFSRLLTGTVTDLRPRQRRTTTLIGARPLPGYDQVLLAIERVLD